MKILYNIFTIFIILFPINIFGQGVGVTKQVFTSRDGTILFRGYTNQRGQTWYYAPNGKKLGYSNKYQYSKPTVKGSKR